MVEDKDCPEGWKVSRGGHETFDAAATELGAMKDVISSNIVDLEEV